jgi:hypothetical protein
MEGVGLVQPAASYRRQVFGVIPALFFWVMSLPLFQRPPSASSDVQWSRANSRCHYWSLSLPHEGEIAPAGLEVSLQPRLGS